MKRSTRWRSRALGFFFSIAAVTLLQGCITVKCDECGQCGSGTGIKDARCYTHKPYTDAEKTMCPSGVVCNSPNGACSTVAVPDGHCVQNGQGGTCTCDCVPN